MNTVWIHIEITCNSRTETTIIVRLMMAQYEGRNMYRQHYNKRNVDTVVSILFFFHEYFCVDYPHYITYILFIKLFMLCLALCNKCVIAKLIIFNLLVITWRFRVCFPHIICNQWHFIYGLIWNDVKPK
jgi:hypothetical protein